MDVELDLGMCYAFFLNEKVLSNSYFIYQDKDNSWVIFFLLSLYDKKCFHRFAF